MSSSLLSRIPFLRPRVIHRLPGRLRILIPSPPKKTGLSIPEIDDWTDFIRDHEGIRSVEYNPVSGKALILFDPLILSEEQVLAAIDRLADLVLESLPSYLKLDNRTKSEFPQRILSFFAGSPFDIKSDKPLELPDDIWRETK